CPYARRSGSTHGSCNPRVSSPDQGEFQAMKISPDVIERVLSDKHYWRRLAVQLLAEAQTRQLNPDSATARAPALSPITESRIQRRDSKVRLVHERGPRAVPMLVGVKTIEPE